MIFMNNTQTLVSLRDFHTYFANLDEWRKINYFNKSILFAVYKNLTRLKFFWPYLIEKNPISSKSGMTPLHYVAQNGQEEVANFMIENLEDCNPANTFGETPLHLASKFGHFKIVEMISRRINPNDFRERYSTARIRFKKVFGSPKRLS